MSTYEGVFGFSYKVLIILGVAVIKSEKPRKETLYLIYVSFLLLLLFMGAIFCSIELYLVRNNIFKVNISLIAVVTITTQGLFKNLLVLEKHSKTQRLFQNLCQKVHEEEDEESQEIFQKAINEMKFFLRFYYTYIFCLGSSWIVPAFIKILSGGKRNLPLPVWFPWNHEESPGFEFSYIIESVYAYYLAINAASGNLCVLGVITQIRAEYDILIKKLRNLGGWCDKVREGPDNVRALTKGENLKVQKELQKNIIHHQKIIR